LIGVVLAGGRGNRLGGGKPSVALAGRPLLEYPVATLRAVCDRVAVVAKSDTVLPSMPSAVERWNEPPEPRHPLAGIVYALETARAAILVCAADMPFLTPEACRSLIRAAGREPAPAVVVVSGGRLQPTFALYRPAALAQLRDAPAGVPLTRVVEALEPLKVPMATSVTRSVNTREDLCVAEAELSSFTVLAPG
jgi:molybdenum cofactor guanylyltransferase